MLKLGLALGLGLGLGIGIGIGIGIGLGLRLRLRLGLGLGLGFRTWLLPPTGSINKNYLCSDSTVRRRHCRRRIQRGPRVIIGITMFRKG